MTIFSVSAGLIFKLPPSFPVHQYSPLFKMNIKVGIFHHETPRKHLSQMTIESPAYDDFFENFLLSRTAKFSFTNTKNIEILFHLNSPKVNGNQYPKNKTPYLNMKTTFISRPQLPKTNRIFQRNPKNLFI